MKKLSILLLCVILFLPTLGSKPFSTRGEPREAIVAQNMYLHSDWLSPEGYAGEVPSKPPLLHWLSASCAMIVGEVNELSARLPAALSSIIFALYFFSFLVRQVGETRAWWSVAILISSFEWSRSAGTCRVDMLLATSMAAALCLLYDWSERGAKGIPFLAVLCLSAGFLSKGPVAIAVPGLIYLVWRLMQRAGIVGTFYECCKIFPLALVIPLCWYLSAYIARPEQFFNKVYYENIARFTSTMDDEPHKHSAFYLYAHLVLGFLPWSLAVIASMFFGLKKFGALLKFERFAALASFVIIAFFSIPSSKRGVYLLPAHPFLALLFATLLEDHTAKLAPWLNKAAMVISYVGVLAILFLGIGAVWVNIFEPSRINSIFLRDALTFFRFVDLFYISLILIIFVLVWRKKLQGMTALLVTVVALTVMVNCSLSRLAAQSLACKEFILGVPELISSDKIYSYGSEFYSVSFYSKRRINKLISQPEQGSIVLAYEHDLNELREKYRGVEFSELRRSPPHFINIGYTFLLLRVGQVPALQ